VAATAFLAMPVEGVHERFCGLRGNNGGAASTLTPLSSVADVLLEDLMVPTEGPTYRRESVKRPSTSGPTDDFFSTFSTTTSSGSPPSAKAPTHVKVPSGGYDDIFGDVVMGGGAVAHAGKADSYPPSPPNETARVPLPWKRQPLIEVGTGPLLLEDLPTYAYLSRPFVPPGGSL